MNTVSRHAHRRTAAPMTAGAPLPFLLLALIGAAILAAASPTALAQGNVRLPRMPALSPDGASITFTWRGDIWIIPFEGGIAKRLTVHPNDDLHSAWSPDGRTIAFTSARDGGRNIFLMNPDGTDVRQITREDNSFSITDWSADGRHILAHSVREGDVYRESRPYRIAADGSDIERLHDAFGSEPAMSPDGRWVVFTRGGAGWDRRGYRGPDARDLWLYDTRDESFRRITDWPGNDGMPRWAGNDTIVFVSDREDDTYNLYSMPLARDGAPAEARRLTRFKGREFSDGVWSFDVSRDGRRIVLHAWDALHTIDLTARTPAPQPVRVLASEDLTDQTELLDLDRRVDEAALSPDGNTMAYVAYGEIFVRNIEDDDRPTRRITDSHAHDREIAWSPCGTRLYFSSDREGSFSIYAATVETTRGEVLEAFERATNPDKPADEAPEEAPEPEADDTPDDNPDNDTDEAADEDPDADAANDDRGDESDKKDEPKKKKEPETTPGQRWQDALTFRIEPVVHTDANEFRPIPSPDGNMLLYRRTRGDLMLHDLRTNESRPVFEHWDNWIEYTWAPDSKHIAYNRTDENYNDEVYIAPIDASWEPVNITKHPNTDGAPAFSADGKVLAFLSRRINSESDVWMVFLDERLEAKTDWELAKYFEDAAKAAAKRKPIPVPDWLAPADDESNADADADTDDSDNEGDDDKDNADSESANADAEESLADQWSLDDAYLRLRRITSLPGSEWNLDISGGGDRLVFTGNDGGSGLFSVDWRGRDQKRLTGSSSVQHVGLDGKTVVIVQGSQAHTVPITGGSVDTHSMSARIRIDLPKQSSQKFHEAARFMHDTFYHPDMKGLDWTALAETYHDLVAHAVTPSEFGDVANRLLGELNASHMGIRPPGDRPENTESNGRLGVDSAKREDGFLITRVLDNSPASKGPMRLHEGDLILAIDGEPTTEHATLAAALEGRIGDEVVLTIRRTPEGGESPIEMPILITPISYGAEVNLRYDQWQYDNARMVHELSDGRLGYLHIRAMSGGALIDFERDLYAAAEGRDGLIIDVRNNGGGSTADRVLASLMVRPHAYTIPRGDESGRTDAYPQDRLFIQRYIRPVNMLCNQKSFSNAEIVSHAFKTLERGTLVGEQTAGGVISTGGISLIDGTSVRMPFRGWFLPDGTDMENNGAMPHIRIPITPADETAGRDPQLEAAVEDLLKRI
ncbi:MAG: S41 family peptidase [Phycisphaerales bacterium]